MLDSFKMQKFKQDLRDIAEGMDTIRNTIRKNQIKHLNYI